MTNGRNSLTQDSRHDPALDRPPAASHRAPTIGAERAVRLALWIAAAWALSAGRAEWSNKDERESADASH